MEAANKENGKKALAHLLMIILIPIVVYALALFLVLEGVASGSLSAMLAVIILLLLLVALASILVVRFKQILKSLGKLAGNFDKIADGSYTLDGNKLTERNDELGQMMRKVNGMMKSFAKVVVGIRTAVDSLDTLSVDFKESFDNMTVAMEQVSREVESITENTVSQAGQTKDIEGKILDMSHAIETIAANVDILTQSADKMKTYNESSEAIMQELVDISEENSESIENVRNQTDLTNRSALEIRQATEIIAGIASQTNLLALNASIEAARAGEQGKGFAVVAEEIRTLADQSRESSEHISKIVNNLIENSNVSVEITQKVSDAFVQQSEKIRETEGIFTKLNQEIASVSTSIGGISKEVSGLDSHKDVMKTGITALAHAAESNTASAKETASAMLEFEGIVTDCKRATDQITSVTRDLVDHIEKINATAEQKKGIFE